MKIINNSDYHTHTFYSDGNNSIEENVLFARKKGLKAIAITDHGPGHVFYGIKEKDILEQRKEIDRLQKKYPDIDILLGIEGNVLGLDGTIDLTDKIREAIDILLVGYHFGSRPAVFFRDLRVHVYNFFQKFLPVFRKRARQLNTQQLVEAMRKNSIDVLTHPGDKGPIDIAAVAKAAEATGTILEINEHHGHLTVDELKVAKKYNVQFIVSSDSHHSRHIGTFKHALNRVQKSGVKWNRILNYKGD